MWSDGLQSIESILGHLAVVITGVGGVWLAIRKIFRKDDVISDNQNNKQVIQGQTVSVEEPWVADMRKTNKILSKRLEKALIRLADHDIDTHDI